MRSWQALLVVGVAMMFLGEREAGAQIGALVSPGRLAKAHAPLEGISNCLSCHSASSQVVTAKCLSCHKPVAERIAQKKGIHRNVTADCVACHVEHAGADAELRPFDQRRFDHAAQTGFPLSGLHGGALATNCAACHKTRSFLAVSTSCASCHTDAHKGTLGPKCETCHTTSVRFAETRQRFDHSRTAFPLAGAHTTAACVSCHPNNIYKGVKFASCSNCHSDPHETRFGQACSTCHTPQTWRTRRVDHSRTSFPLRGSHATVECVMCHVQPAMKVALRFQTCATCHADPHRGTFKQDCSACHTESGFQKGAFDHSTTRFPLVDRHAGPMCAACHKAAPSGPAPAAASRVPAPRVPVAPRAPVAARPPVAVRTADFRGLSTTCVSCHADVHRGELGTTCESCHSARTFTLTAFTHAQPRSFFNGQHAALRCEQCHIPATPAQPPIGAVRAAVQVRVGFRDTSATCASCHRDAHLGQVAAQCETCHSVDTAHFAVVGFSHEGTAFRLTGKHVSLACESCHKVETRDFPSGRGTARRLTGIGTACVACHEDRHDGQLDRTCETCHTTTTFAIPNYTHRNARILRSFFTGKHVTPRCEQCHKPAPAKVATLKAVLNYRVSTTCVSCHQDVHRGALGPNCETCHRP